MSECRSSQRTAPGRSGAARLSAVWALWLLGWFVLGSGAAGCSTSIYHRTRTTLPPEPAAELRLRLAEARQALGSVEQVGIRLLDDLQRGHPAAVREADFDRLEVAVFELERRVLAVQDVAPAGSEVGRMADDLKTLRAGSDAWLAYARNQRASDPATQRRQLEILVTHR